VTKSILTCSPYFTEAALNELRRYHPQITFLQHLAPGYILLQAPYSFDKLTAPWRHRSSIYLHHLFPVHAVLALDGRTGDLNQLRETARQIAPADVTFQIRGTDEVDLPYSLAEIERYLNGERAASTDAPKGRILSILTVRNQGGLQAHMGVSWATQNLSPWAGGQIPITEPVSNRAGYKLIEALDVFGIRLREGDHALDLGAAPGAWTTLLRRRGLKVTAVAPTPLYPWLAFDPDVTYQPLRAEEYVERCQTTFHLIVNDMRLDGQDSARLMVEYARHLRSGGIAIMTLKVREHNRPRVIDHSFRLLRKAYKIIQVRQLVSNRNEVTLFLRKVEER
jgi:23S rRNA (cytidine2498-2'-O)-methyltransferase